MMKLKTARVLAAVFLSAFMLIGLQLLIQPVHGDREPTINLQEEPAPALLSKPSGTQPIARTSDPTIMRERSVYVNFDLLGGDGRQTPKQRETAVALNLFEDVVFIAQKTAVETIPGGYIWYGEIKDSSPSQVIIVVRDGVLAADIRLPEGVYQIRSAADGLYKAQELNEAGFPEIENDFISVEPNVSGANQPSPTAVAADDGSVIDVMISYTQDARQDAGGEASMIALVYLAVAQANAAYANSGITQRIRLVHHLEVAYTESGSAGADLSRLQNTSDGYIDHLHPLRDAYGADLVALWTKDGGGVCGLAYLMTFDNPGFESSGFSFNQYGCATGIMSFAHETGHNMGAHHDWYVEGTSGSAFSPYYHGYIDTTAGWRTIMSYTSHCTALGISCPKIPNFSNPDVDEGGNPTGVLIGTSDTCAIGVINHPDCDADNRTVLNNTALTVSNFRQTQVFAEISKSASSTFVDLGDPITYTLVVKNNSAFSATNTLITDTVPLSVTLNAGSLSGDATNSGVNPGSIITWTTGIDIQPGETITRTFIVTAVAQGTISNIGYVATDNAAVSVKSNTVDVTVRGRAACGFEDGFESGVLNLIYWTTHTTNDGRIRVLGETAGTAPHSGSYQAILDDSVGGGSFSEAAIILTADLTGQTKVELDFWWVEHQDENHPEDGVFISDDEGANWYEVLSFNDGPGSYRNDVIDIVTAAAANGLTLNDSFQIKFQFYDNYAFEGNNDGYAIDDVQLNCEADLTVSKSVSPTTAQAGDPITYTLSFANVGSATAVNVALTDTIPVSVTNTSVISAGAAIAQTSSGYVWSVQDLAPGEGGTITITGELSNPLAAGTFTNTAVIATTSTDSNTANNSASVPLTVLNSPPIAAPNTYTTMVDTSLSAPVPGVLANDADTNGDMLTAILNTDVTSGALSLSTDGSFVYTPTLSFCGADSFAYHANDGALDSNVVLVTLNVRCGYNLTVNLDGAGSGSVGSDPVGIDCGVDCNETYAPGAAVTLTTTVDAGFFSGWSGACSGADDCVVMMDTDVDVTAIFSLYSIYLPVIVKP
ncbi:MAG: DUF11 domain-containing protein [Chloroflexi bacterium]|nr:DUF11 domain-containing protein [Chloroflexota bacterium]